MSSIEKLRVGIAGCGYQGGILAKAISKTQSWQLAACADTNLEAARGLAAGTPDAKAHASVEEMLDRTAVDVVFVATPHEQLCRVALAAIGAGKHVLVEKPIGVREAEAAQIETAAARAGVCVESGYSFRYIPAWWRVHELLEAGAVGEIQAISGVFACSPLLKGWVAAPETGGGPLLFLGSHLIDQILWYVGEAPDEVFGTVSRRPDTKADDTSVFQMHFAGGSTAQCIVTQASAVPVFGLLSVFGREGRISLSPFGFLDFEITVASKKLPEYAEEQKIRIPLADDVRMVKHAAQLEEFAQAIREKRQPRVTVADGRNVLKVIDAVLKSGETHQPIRLSSR
jgi:predicted dehydrogenase